MILFFKTPQETIIATEMDHQPSQEETSKLCWLFGGAECIDTQQLDGIYVGPRREMVTPWSTNAVEITENMNLSGITRIEEYFPVSSKEATHDPMLQRMYEKLDQSLFTVNHEPEPIKLVENLEQYNEDEGLALSPEEMAYLHTIEKQNGRPLTDSEIFGFAQINSEHCRHKIFSGTFIIDGEEKESSLFAMIKRTTQENPGKILSAYKDNVAFAQGPVIEQFAPADQSTSDYFQVEDIESVISLKAETHNFPTTVEPFNGAATGTGGEIRDRMGGGVGSWPLAGTAVYMTAYPRLEGDSRTWEDILPVRKWLYQTPEQILIKASNGASDFGNKFGQPLICGSVLTFEHQEDDQKLAYDKVIMLAGGVGYGKKRDCLKKEPQKGNKVVVVGGDNYRIGLGGGSVSSVDTGRYTSGIELNAIQRANPEMQKRAYNLVRALVEEKENPVVSIHDHGSAGHLNCLSELVEECGGEINMTKLPIGDKTLSAKEIIANESQERMGLLIDERHLDHVKAIAERERAPLYVVGETTGDAHFSFVQADGVKPFDLDVAQMFGHSPKTIMTDETVTRHYEDVTYSTDQIDSYINKVLQLEAVACKDWLTNKVDRSVTGKIARQQCQGEIQLPLSDCGVVALDYRGKRGIATALGHAPQAGLASPEAGSVLSVAESLTNIVWAPLEDGLEGVSLSANWMWPCRAQKGEDARLYAAVEALSDFCCSLHINVPTGKDSLSLTQKYPNGEKIISPGTVIVSAGSEVKDVRNVVSPVLVNNKNSSLYYIDFSFDDQRIGGSAFAQSLGKVGSDVPTVKNPEYFADCFEAIQTLINKGWVMAGHDISAGGLITTLLEMTFANQQGGIHVNLYDMSGEDVVKNLFAENPGVVIQVSDLHKHALREYLESEGIGYAKIGYPTPKERKIVVKKNEWQHEFDIDALREAWYQTSYELDKRQSMNGMADQRHRNYKAQPLQLRFNDAFTGKLSQYQLNADRRTPSGIRAAIIREKGTNGEREMAYALYLAGFDVKDVMMTDLISGRETLEDINLIVFCGGFSNSDVLGSAKGWAGAFLYNPKAKEALDRFYARKDTLSLGICNGCQLMVELNLINPEHQQRTRMLHNDSHKFESAFLGLTIPENNSVMLGSLSGSKLGIWVAHGEGKFSLPEGEENYHIVAKYSYNSYPGNPNGSDYSVAGICSKDGRHLAMMPHLERSIFPWQNAYYPYKRHMDEVTPWIEAFVNAREWVEKQV
ncbi:phosphoribosylformylglycinamidine synthase [Hoylesella buccalis]|uniref:phosphoribosylformylglycinamidine synthase n=1 Tax=Hoylesella buccalis TaxID=28127 RepID=UPI001D08580E|nr:phosphoribosylformylglycinamidine synthase [Hoylesella buccalis]MCB6901950.1 phosphoribosylformylglycinamidine synthase [Hoylesella buccalis]UEA63550.1 phosphoribosylformylglycinamidine synthase [Hoylesella buccalis]UWP49159.1 phosphoribosylformylglycinamidine synthase [Hoylesella buccalis ATCC 35310]